MVSTINRNYGKHQPVSTCQASTGSAQLAAGPAVSNPSATLPRVPSHPTAAPDFDSTVQLHSCGGRRGSGWGSGRGALGPHGRGHRFKTPNRTIKGYPQQQRAAFRYFSSEARCHGGSGPFDGLAHGPRRHGVRCCVPCSLDAPAGRMPQVTRVRMVLVAADRGSTTRLINLKETSTPGLEAVSRTRASRRGVLTAGVGFHLWTHRDPHGRTYTCGCVRSVSPAIRASQLVTVAATGQADSAGIMRRACSRRTACGNGGRSPC